MKVGDICNRDLVCLKPDASLAQAAQLMRERHVGMVVVTKSPLDRPVAVGVLTDRDIAFAALDGKGDLSRLRLEDFLTRDPLVLTEETPIAQAIDRMRERSVRRTPVVDAHGMLVGVASIDDLLAGIAEELTGLANLLQWQPERENPGQRRP